MLTPMSFSGKHEKGEKEKVEKNIKETLEGMKKMKGLVTWYQCCGTEPYHFDQAEPGPELSSCCPRFWFRFLS
jgi:hypothetical protein